MTRPVVLALLLLALVPASAHAITPPAFRDGPDVHVAKVEQLSPRLVALTLETPLLTAPTNVRILFPESYDADPARRYPVLWLFHGTSGGAADWTTMGEAEQATAGRDVIVVMPDAGVNSDGGSWFTDWVNGGAFGPPKWETWHIQRLIPWVDAQVRSIGERRGRAIAGLSQGGFGAMSYAARHPELFVAAATFSGAVDISANPEIVWPLVTPIVNATEVALVGVPPNTFFGDRASNELNWAAHDPATLAGNLRGMRLYAWTGNGANGPLDPPGVNPGGAAIEAGVHTLTTLFKGELDERGIPIEYHDYGPGTHTWPYWARDLRELIGPLMKDFAGGPGIPAEADYMSADDAYEQWGWKVTLKRPAREFSRLSDADASGFTLTGSGDATVVSPPLYRPGARATAGRDELRVADDGRLTVRVALGPGNPNQQYLVPGEPRRRASVQVRVDAPPPCRGSARVRLALPPLPRGARLRSVRVTRAGSARALRATRRGRRLTVALPAGERATLSVRVRARTRAGRLIARRAVRTVVAPC